MVKEAVLEVEQMALEVVTVKDADGEVQGFRQKVNSDVLFPTDAPLAELIPPPIVEEAKAVKLELEPAVVTVIGEKPSATKVAPELFVPQLLQLSSW